MLVHSAVYARNHKIKSFGIQCNEDDGQKTFAET